MAKVAWILGAIAAPFLVPASFVVLTLFTMDGIDPWMIVIPLMTVAVLFALGLTYPRVFPDRWPL